MRGNGTDVVANLSVNGGHDGGNDPAHGARPSPGTKFWNQQGDHCNELREMRRCSVARCRAELTVVITDDEFLPLNADVDTQFVAAGWSAYFCPAHKHL